MKESTLAMPRLTSLAQPTMRNHRRHRDAGALLRSSKLIAIAACQLFAITVPALAQQARKAQPIDFAGIRQASEPQISPQGKFGAFVLNSPLEVKSPTWLSRRTIWIRSLDEGEEWKQPYSDLAESWSPIWSPDGKHLAFLARRTNSATESGSTENAQIFIADADGSNPTPLTAARGGVDAFRWAPDSKTIAFTTLAIPEAEAEANTTKTPMLFTVDVHRKTARKVLRNDEDIAGFSWGPNSSTIAVLKRSASNKNDWLPNKSVLLVDIATQSPIKDISLDTGYVTLFKWSPSGRYIFFHGPSATRATVVPMLLDLKAGKAKALPMRQGGDILEAEWAPDSSQLRAKIFDKNSGIISAIDVESGASTSLVTASADWVSGKPTMSFSDQGNFIYLKETSTSPADVWLSIAGRKKKLTDLNPDTRNLKLYSIKEITWHNKDDHRIIHGMLITPSETSSRGPFPLITLVHGGPYWAWWDGWQEGYMGWGQFLASHGYAVFLPNPRGSQGVGPDYADAIVGDLGGVDFIDIMSGIDSLIANGTADPERLGIGGFSYGGFMTSWAITQTNRFKAAVAGGIVSNWISLYETVDIPGWPISLLQGTPQQNPKIYYKRSPVYQAANASTPTLIYQGDVDTRTPPGQAKELYEALKKNNVETKIILFKGEGHYFNDRNNTVSLMENVLQWFNTYLK